MNDTEFQPTDLSELIPSSAEDVTPVAQPEATPTPELAPETNDQVEPTDVKPEPGPSPDPQDNETSRQVPLAALENERRQRQEAQAELQRMQAIMQQNALMVQQPLQEQPAVPDPWEDPEAALQHQAQQIEQKFQAELAQRDAAMVQTRIAMSEELMRSQHQDYDAVVDVFTHAAQNNEYLARQMMAAPNPAAFAYNAGRQMQLVQQVGSDPDAYRAKIEAEILAKHGIAPNGQAPSRQPSAPVPTSLASTPSAPVPASQNGGWDGPKPLDQLIPE